MTRHRKHICAFMVFLFSLSRSTCVNISSISSLNSFLIQLNFQDVERARERASGKKKKMLIVGQLNVSLSVRVCVKVDEIERNI